MDSQKKTNIKKLVKVAKFDNIRQEEAPVEAAPKETIFGINEKGEFKLRKDL